MHRKRYINTKKSGNSLKSCFNPSGRSFDGSVSLFHLASFMFSLSHVDVLSESVSFSNSSAVQNPAGLSSGDSGSSKARPCDEFEFFSKYFNKKNPIESKSFSSLVFPCSPSTTNKKYQRCIGPGPLSTTSSCARPSRLRPGRARQSSAVHR